jgi:5-methylcytosine-specific restriction endonuclease McrA
VCNSELRKVKNIRARASVVTRLARLRGIKPPKRKNIYAEYLRSKEWQFIRNRVLSRDGFRCQLCSHKANQVHHRSYEPEVMSGECDNQLISLCKKCHRGIHRQEGKRCSLKVANKQLDELLAARG